MLQLIALTEPDVIVIGGSVGCYFERYGDLLEAELKQFETPLFRSRQFVKAQRPDQAVVFGCYDYAVQVNAR